MADDRPIIIVKKKGGHGGHHGGAWKVAYADFVTAMMAFFMVMWLLNTAESRVKKAVASYFRKPGIFEHGSPFPIDKGAGLGILDDSYQPPRHDELFGKWQLRRRLPTLREEIEQELLEKRRMKGLSDEKPKELTDHTAPLVDEIPKESGKSVVGATHTKVDSTNMDHKKLYLPEKINSPASSSEIAGAAIKGIADNIKEQLLKAAELRSLLGDIEVKVDKNGLEIEIMDTNERSMFSSGSARLEVGVQGAFKKLVGILQPFTANLQVIGHTDAKPYSKGALSYTNWELSADRANAARRELISAGLNESKIAGVVGKGAIELKEKKEPFAAANRRITLRAELNVPSGVQEDLTGPSKPLKIEELGDKDGRPLTIEEIIQSARRKRQEGKLTEIPEVTSYEKIKNPDKEFDKFLSRDPIDLLEEFF
jgi:chemotaxis protein MotB